MASMCYHSCHLAVIFKNIKNVWTDTDSLSQFLQILGRRLHFDCPFFSLALVGYGYGWQAIV